MELSTNPQDWLTKADGDLWAIDIALKADQPLWDVACLHAEQAVEKSLMAYLVSGGARPEIVNDLVELRQRARTAGFGDELDEGLCRTLTGCYEAYSEPGFHSGRAHAEPLVEFARSVRRRVEAAINHSMSS